MYQSIIKDKQSDYITVSVLGIIIYNIALLINVSYDYKISLAKVVYVISIMMFFFGLFECIIKSWKDGIQIKNIVAVIVLCLWTVVMLFESKMSEVLNYFNYLYNYGALPYSLVILTFVPALCMIRSFTSFFYKFNYLCIFLCFFPLMTTNTTFIQLIVESFTMGAAFIFITNRYHEKKYVYVSLIVLFISFIVVTLLARRNLMLTIALYIAIGVINLIFNGRIKTLESRIITILSGLLLLIGAASFYMQESSGAFSTLNKRISANTREEVFTYFFMDFHSSQDLVRGRGIFGKYYCPGVDEEEDGVYYDDRGNIECGYLQALLKGGFVYLFLYMFIFISAIFRGFKSNNQLCKACACIVLIQLIDMVPFGLHAFNVKTFMIWMAVAVCLNKQLVKLSNKQISELLFYKKGILLSWQKE